MTRKVFSTFTHHLVGISRAVFGEHVFLSVPADERSEFEEVRVPLIPQKGETFGEKLSGSIQEVLNMGYDRLLILGNDCPLLDVRLLKEAQTRFSKADIILGPDHKGGIYLLGLTREHVGVLSNIQWNENTDFEQLLEECRQWAKLEILETRHDLDSRFDLQKILSHALGLSRHFAWLLLKKLQAPKPPTRYLPQILDVPSVFAHIRIANQLPPPSSFLPCHLNRVSSTANGQ